MSAQAVSEREKKRYYQPIWELLIKQQTVIVSDVHPSEMHTVIKAVRKEKWKDLAFKMMNTGDTWRLYAEVDRDKREIKFTLKGIVGVMDVVEV